jgi:hypothetical protein
MRAVLDLKYVQVLSSPEVHIKCDFPTRMTSKVLHIIYISLVCKCCVGRYFQPILQYSGVGLVFCIMCCINKNDRNLYIPHISYLMPIALILFVFSDGVTCNSCILPTDYLEHHWALFVLFMCSCTTHFAV